MYWYNIKHAKILNTTAKEWSYSVYCRGHSFQCATFIFTVAQENTEKLYFSLCVCVYVFVATVHINFSYLYYENYFCVSISTCNCNFS
jgi:hypothetical protein